MSVLSPDQIEVWGSLVFHTAQITLRHKDMAYQNEIS